MGLESVIDEILAAGEEQRRKIHAESATERQKVLSAAKSEAESLKKDRQHAFEKKSVMMHQQAISSSELEAKKRTLQEQNMILSRTKKNVLQSLSTMETSQRKDLLDRLVKIGAKRLSKGIIHCRKEDEKIVTVPNGINKVADLKAAGGILVESEDGAYQIDLTFEVLVDDVWMKNIRRIYEMIFGGA